MVLRSMAQSLTPHMSTGKSPMALLFGHATESVRIASNKTIHKTEDMKEAELNDQIAKERMKQYRDGIGLVGEKTLKIGDIVRVRNNEPQKSEPLYSVETYRVTKIEGSRITASNQHKLIIRDISQFKTTAQECPKIGEEREKENKYVCYNV